METEEKREKKKISLLQVISTRRIAGMLNTAKRV